MIAEKEHCVICVKTLIVFGDYYRYYFSWSGVCSCCVITLYTWWAQPKSTPGFNEGFPYHAQKSQQSLFWVIDDLKNKTIGF